MLLEITCRGSSVCKKPSDYDQEMPQFQITDQPMTSRGTDKQRYTDNGVTRT